MMEAPLLLVLLIQSGLKNRAALAVENLALRQRLAISNRKRPQYFPNENYWMLKSQSSILWHETVLV